MGVIQQPHPQAWRTFGEKERSQYQESGRRQDRQHRTDQAQSHAKPAEGKMDIF